MKRYMAVSIKTDEIVNSLTHLIGVGLSITALVLMIIRSSVYGTPISVVGASIFGASLIALYLSSTLYHAAKKIKLKIKLNKLDHSAIYVLIAGTYTPFTIVLMQGGWGWSIFGIQWGLAIAGILFKVFWYKPKYRKLSAWAYVAMGLVIVVALRPLIDSMSTMGLIWLAIGGIVYMTGVFFYLSKKIPFSHGIWHLFVLGGSIAHFFAIYNHVLPNLSF